MLVEFKLKISHKNRIFEFKVTFSSKRSNSMLLISFGFLNSGNIQRHITQTFKVQSILLRNRFEMSVIFVVITLTKSFYNK